MVSDMTEANGYNFTWYARTGGESYFNKTIERKAVITIDMGDEENVDDIGGIGSNQYSDNVTVEMLISATGPVGDILASDTDYYNSLELSKALDDVKKRWPSNRELCDLGVQSFLYSGATVEVNRDQDKFSTHSALVRFSMLYISDRGL